MGREGEVIVLRTLQGIYRDGEIQLIERPADVQDGTRVLVTFLTRMPVNLAERGVDSAGAADLRDRLATFAEEWDSPEMDIYDDYDAARAGLQAR